MTRRSILVTGANGAIGRAIARWFLESPDFDLWLGVRNRRDEVDALVQAHADRCWAVELDVTRREQWQAAVGAMVGRKGRIDVLINNAGFSEDHLLGTMAVDSWDRVREANLDAVFHGCQAVLPSMISQRYGRIITISSLSALLAPAGQANYAAAKAGSIALTRSLAKEVARIGITVNAVCPGYVESEALDGLSGEQRQKAVSQIPMRRFGRPEEVAGAVGFLASDQAGYITGSVLKIDGGIY